MYLLTLLPRLESQGPENIVDQVRKLRIDEIFLSEHNTARIKTAAMAVHYKAYVRNEDIQASVPAHTGTLTSISLSSSAWSLPHFWNAQIAWPKSI